MTYNQITEKQALYIRYLIAKIEAREVVIPKKISRWNDPMRAHQQHVAKARKILAMLDAHELTASSASTHITTLTALARGAVT